MSGIHDARARLAAAALMKASRAALARYATAAVGDRNPLNKNNWPSQGEYVAYIHLARALATGETHGLEETPHEMQDCSSCHFFAALASTRAHYWRTEVEGEGRIGVCTAHPPALVTNEEGEAEGSVWTPVNRSQWCGEFQRLAPRVIR